MKDKEWLKEEIKKLLTVRNQFYPHDEMVDLGLVLLAIDQLDEPQKPVIPQFVADWIERNKQPDYGYENKEDALADSIHFALYSLEANYPETNPDVILRRPVNEWLENDRKNYWKLIDGVRYGYEVEKEKLYHVIDSNNETLLCKVEGEVMTVAKAWYIGYEQEFYHLTEKEIKDYDERYWSFAEEVKE